MPEAKLNVKLLRYTSEPELACATAAHLCYSNSSIADLQAKMSSEKVEKLLSRIIEEGHWSVLEHASFTFGIEGISRACSHQLVRHRLASYSQQSQRFANESGFNYIIPPKIKQEKKALEKFEKFIEESRKNYSELIELGIPKEDSRFVLPNACETRIAVTMNARALYNFFERRLCTRAQWEIRILANAMKKELVKVAPLLFKNVDAICERLGYCPEKESCGRYPLKKDLKLFNGKQKQVLIEIDES